MKSELEQNSINFSWDKNLGYGYLPVSDFPYDDAYFEKYEGYAGTEFGQRLNAWRVSFVKRFCSGAVLDIGIGCGSFIKSHGNAKGYDVCGKAIEWLKARGLFLDPYAQSLDEVEALTFFDSFEHIDKLEGIMEKISKKKVFISIPIFSDYHDAVTSKHFRPNEHFHYFSINALIGFMRSYGLRCVWTSDFETQLGREAIVSFFFKPGEV